MHLKPWRFRCFQGKLDDLRLATRGNNRPLDFQDLWTSFHTCIIILSGFCLSQDKKNPKKYYKSSWKRKILVCSKLHFHLILGNFQSSRIRSILYLFVKISCFFPKLEFWRTSLKNLKFQKTNKFVLKINILTICFWFQINELMLVS